MTLVLRWRALPPDIVTRWRGPAGMAEAVRRDPTTPIAAIVGPVGPSPAVVEIEVAEAISAGQPVRPNGAGRLALARADSLANARQVALAATSAAPGHAARIQRDFVTLADWTAATGAAGLVPQAEYFLGADGAGLLTTVPPAAGVVLAVGIALNSTTLAVGIGQPILL